MTISKIFLIMVVLILSVDGYGQSTWFKIYGGPRTDMNYSVLRTKDNNVLTVGYRQVYSPSNGIYIGQTYLNKFDLAGNLMWDKIIGDSLFGNFSYSAVEDRYGNLYIPVSTENNRLYKINSEGNILWSKQYSNSQLWQWLAVQFISDSNKIVISGLSWNYKINLNLIDTSGNLLKYKEINSQDTLNDYSGGYFIIKDNYIYLCYGPGSGGSYISHIGKFDLDFNQIWDLQIPTGYGVNSIVSISDRNIMGLGSHWNPPYIYINKFDIYGNLLWGKNYDTLTNDNSIYKTMDNNIAIVGNYFYDTAKFAIIDTIGNPIREVKHPYKNGDYIVYYDIMQTLDSSFILVGRYHDTFYSDCIVIKTNKDGNTIPLGIYSKYLNTNDISISVYPNPFNSHLTLNINSINQNKINIRLFNILGQVVYELNSKLKYEKNRILLNFKELKLVSDIYFLQISGENFNIFKKLIYLK